MEDILKRLENTFADRSFLKRISTSRKRWLDYDIETVVESIVSYFKGLK